MHCYHDHLEQYSKASGKTYEINRGNMNMKETEGIWMWEQEEISFLDGILEWSFSSTIYSAKNQFSPF